MNYNSLNIKILYRICLFLFLSISAFPQQTVQDFDYLSVDNGLSTNTTRFVYQDKKGFLWIATEDGLNRYDGYTFKHFKPDPKNKNSLSDNAVYKIYQDNSGIFWITTRNGLNVLDPVKETFTRYNHNKNDPHSISDDKVDEIVEDSSGKIWIGSRKGLNLYRRDESKFYRFQANPEVTGSLSNDHINALHLDRKGMLWVATQNGLNKFNPEDSTFIAYYYDLNNPKSLSNNFINCIFEDSEGNLWIGTISGLNKLVPVSSDSLEFVVYKRDPLNTNSLSNNNVKTICEDDEKNLWIGTIGGGINIFNPTSGNFYALKNNPQNPKSLSDDFIFHLKKDNTGIIWVSTYSKGVSKYTPAKRRFLHYRPELNTHLQIKENDVTALLVDNKNHLWIATNGNGITVLKNGLSSNRFETEDKIVYRMSSVNSLSNNYVTSMIQDRDGLVWIGTFGGGLNRFDPKTKLFTVYKYDKDNPHSLSHNFVQSIYEDKDGFIWAGTGLKGVCRLDKSTGLFKRYTYDPEDPNNNKNPNAIEVTAICEDSAGNIWFGSSTEGINKFDKKNQTFTFFSYIPDDPVTLSSNRILCIYFDKQTRLWAGTYGGGFNLYNEQANSFIHYTQNDGLAGNTVMAITEDHSGKLWISTNNGISRFDPETKKFKSFDVNDGLQGNEFNPGAVFNDEANNKIYFGGKNGLNIFQPHLIRDNLIKPEIVLTDFKLFNQSVSVLENTVLDGSISYANNITLSHDQNVIAFEFSALHFINPAKNNYAYKMDGFDRDWIYAGTKRYAEYTNLDPGNYVFRVKSSNSDGIWNEEGASIKIVIAPPFWKTWWAYIIYIVIIVLSFLTIRKYELNRVRLKNQLKLKELESKKYQEIDDLKSKFFANISHEFRTPLTIILGSLDKLTKEMAQTPDLKEYTVMKRNASRLLQLINQLLELSRIESGSVKLNASEADIVKFLKRITASFSSLAYQKNQKLFFNGTFIENASVNDEMLLYFDKKKLETVFYNLLSNAIKFTPREEKIKVSIHSEEEFVKISFVNTGVEIPPEKLEKVFDRFYQVDDSETRNFVGTGIGLSLAKEYVEMHKGKIEVESINNETSFTIYIPIGKSHLSTEEISTETEDNHSFDLNVLSLESQQSHDKEIQEIESTDIDKTKILIVEDNYDLREMIKEILRDEYVILEAENGIRGQDIAIEQIPDLIISDIMMPGMDGNQLARLIKTNEKTNHIPIILLTAKATTKDKLEGLGTGADDYLIKPFNEQELKIRVRNLIKIRQQMREKYQSQMLIKPNEVIIPSTQKTFIDKLIKIIEANMSNENFSVEVLCNEMGMSRSQLHRKIKAVTNQSTSEFIRNFRLQRAAELLEKDAGNIAEICYMVGFNSQNYFTKMFQNLYGKTPLEYKREHTK
jgi:signal transduction histidine kinase/ligand-binding sensor domain-containing protein/DNA-binding response OmpR family regulator